MLSRQTYPIYNRKIFVIICFSVLTIIFYPYYAVCAETPSQLFQEKLNYIWLIVSASMVFFMQVGFTAFEAGSVQAKNAISVAVKNILGFLVSSIMYFLLGFGIMFGASYEGYLGTSNFCFSALIPT